MFGKNRLKIKLFFKIKWILTDFLKKSGLTSRVKTHLKQKTIFY